MALSYPLTLDLKLFMDFEILQKEGKLILDKFFINAELGRLLGIHRVTAARIINKLIRGGIIFSNFRRS